MSCALTQDYEIGCDESFGGISTIYLIEKENITVEYSNGSVVTLVKSAGKYYRKYDIQEHTGEGKEIVALNSQNGTSNTKQTIMFPLNGLSSTIGEEISKLSSNRLNIILIDNNGVGFMYGADFGMRLVSTSTATGKSLLDRNGYDFVFESDEKTEALFVDSSLISSLQTPGIQTYFTINGSSFLINGNSFIIN